MNNSQIAAVLDQVADLLEFQAANPFRVRAYRNAARLLHDLAEPVTAILADTQRKLSDLPGIGRDLADKIAELVETGELPQLNELLAAVPPSVLTLLRIPGLGPKKAAALHAQLGVSTLDELRAACEAGRVRELKGFGTKTEQAILANMQFATTAQSRMYWADADQIVLALREHFAGCPGIAQLEFAGSYRRGKETVGDLDVLAVSSTPAQVMDCLATFAPVVDVLARGETKMSVRTHHGLQIDLRVVEARSFGAALQYFTGSKDHNVILRGLARQRGLKINEYGVFRVADQSEEYVAGATEQEVYGALDLPAFPPELREARQEFEWARQNSLPQLVEVSDIRGDLHVHTDDTDGRASLEEMVQAAQQRGLSYLAITDHSQRVSMARGLNADRLLAQWARIDRLNEQLRGFSVLKGIECDILERGGMDLPDEILAQADWVNASIHYGQRQSRQQITERILQAVEHPYVTAIAHPTGRLINRREAYDVDLDAVIKAAGEHGKCLELNASPQRLDLDDVQCAAAKARGVMLVLSTDAHGPEGFDDLRYGVLQARRGGLTRSDIVNTHSWPQLKTLLQMMK
jgi:DNA polymerase (family 10)